MSDVTGATGAVPPGETEADEAVAALLDPLEGLDARPVSEHPAAYEEVHGRLRAALAGGPRGDAAPQA